MEPYKNVSKKSGIVSFDIQKNGILIEFINGDRYLYDYEHPGKSKVEYMKVLALKGKGLSTYISQVIRKNFAKKLK